MNKTKIALFAFFGNALEFYEFTIYAIFANVFAREFFVTDSEVVSLIMSWGGFAAAFMMRPLGALLFGTLGDVFGRKIVLCVSILIMALATLGIGLLPNAAEIGIMAPLLLVALRMIQGLATGGEYNGAAIFLIEKFKYNRPGLMGSLVTSSCAFGAVIGVLIGRELGDEFWRWAFIAGGTFGVILFLLRFTLPETQEDHKIFEEEDFTLTRGEYIQKYISNILVGGLNGAMSYSLFGFSILYAQRYLGADRDAAFLANIAGMLAFMLGTPFFGHLYDKITGRIYWPVILPLCAVAIYPTFYIATTGMLVLGIFLLGLITAATEGPDHAFFQEDVPAKIRFRFVGTSFTIGMALFGGTTPMILTSMIDGTGDVYAPAYWISGMCMLVLLWLKRGVFAGLFGARRRVGVTPS